MNKPLLEKAKALQNQGKFEDAIKIYRQLLDEDSNQPDLWHILAVLLAQSQQYDDALTAIDKAIKQQPNAANLYNSKGNIFLRIKKFKEAQLAFQKAIKIEPNYAAAYSNLGNSFYQQKKLEPAQNAYEKATQLQPNFVDAHYNLGLLFTQLGDHEKAIQALDKTIQLQPQHAYTYGQLGNIYLHQKQYEKAIEHLEKRLSLQPNHADTHHNLGLALLETKQLELAIDHFENTLILEPHHPECHHNLANAYLQSGDQNKALTYYFRQLEVNPLAESYYNIGVIMMYQERQKEAIQYLQHAAQMEPNYLPVHLNLGSLYLKMHQHDQAIAAYQMADKIQPNNPEIQYIISALSDEKNKNKPEQAPTAYLEHLFDQYAIYYDKHLTQYLHYQVPQKLRDVMDEEINIHEAKWTILDLGCGTGLSGKAFHDLAERLIGVDISSQMIEIAKQKKLYDKLEVADIQEALDHYKAIDLVLAADVFTYIGNLETIFEKVKNALTSDGLFTFTVEKCNTIPYKLRKTMRFAHSENYLQQLIKQYDFSVLRFDNIVLRTQQKKNIEGFLVLLKNIGN